MRPHRLRVIIPNYKQSKFIDLALQKIKGCDEDGPEESLTGQADC